MKPLGQHCVRTWSWCVLLLWAFLAATDVWAGLPWPRHVIDGTLPGADGVRMADANGDGRLDVATGFEEGGATRVYLHPGDSDVYPPWPAVTVGETPDVEDAVLVDLDGNGLSDVVSCCEGGTRRVFVHWSPAEVEEYLRPEAWETEALPAPDDGTLWMFALPLELDARRPPALVIGGKQGADQQGALLGLLLAPQASDHLDNLDKWRFVELARVGWIMSIQAVDVDADGDADIVYSDRRNIRGHDNTSGVYWLENPGAAETAGAWPKHAIGALGREVMFIDVVDFDGDGGLDVLAAVKPKQIHHFSAPDDPRRPWTVEDLIEVEQGANGVGTAKAVRAGDLDGDGSKEIAYSCEHATGSRSGIVWLDRDGKQWSIHDLSGPEGIKFDRIELVDLDGDGDLDLLTTEERYTPPGTPHSGGLGVVWYENTLGAR